jgi:hypothetical protein
MIKIALISAFNTRDEVRRQTRMKKILACLEGGGGWGRRAR